MTSGRNTCRTHRQIAPKGTTLYLDGIGLHVERFVGSGGGSQWIYDPVLGRFMTADPIVQHPEDLQDFNRYAFVHNNPLAFTDPTGYGLFGRLFQAIGSFLHSFLHNPIVQAVEEIAAAITSNSRRRHLQLSSRGRRAHGHHMPPSR
ncbi:MAG TPA: RHS repeat-associated core domain-containing protein [Candidatus Cybelea sp.]|nr:RHS repeat-associated core domain-containing protein [Candidatus Cybelea sp.]